MKRSNDDLASRVYSYGSVPSRIAPVIGEDRANQQFGLAHRFWNVLVAIDRRRSERYRKIMHDEAQKRIEQVRDKIADLRNNMQAARQQARKRSVDLAAEKQAIDSLRTEMTALIEQKR